MSATTDDHHMQVKRVPNRLPTRRNELYVRRKSRRVDLIERAKRLLQPSDLSSREEEIVVYGLGAAVKDACEVALAIVDACDVPLTLVTETGTQALIDDFEPLVENVDGFSKKRFNSFVRIRIVQVEPPRAPIKRSKDALSALSNSKNKKRKKKPSQ